MTIRTVLFDLDGTLADTAPDLAAALNFVLEAEGEAALPFERIRPVVSHGGIALLRLGFGIEPGTARFDDLRERFLGHYRKHIVQRTRLFPGMAGVLDHIERRGMRWGVVTNKPGWLTEPLIAGLGLAARAAAVVSGDTLAQRKPDPAPMLLACRQAGCAAAECLYVGDAARDVEAGRNAGMRTLVALFGYIDAQDEPTAWGADGMVESPQEILDWLG
jgi:2-phosphoglycolate phosphatase